MKKSSFVVAAMGMALAASPAHAAYVINMAESGSNVVATGSGSLNVSGLTYRSDLTLTIPTMYSYMAGTGNILLTGSPGTFSLFQTMTPAPQFGTGNTTFATSSTGSKVGIMSNQFLLVPKNYVSGSDLGTTITTFANASFASLGLTAGSYVWTWGTGGNADSFTLNIGPVAGAVPEPATWALMILGFGFIGGAMRRRTQQTPRVRFDFA